MKASKITIAILFAAASFSSMAATVDKDMPSVTVSAAQGPNSGEGYMGYTGFVSTKTRAQVVQELHDAQRRGEIYSGEAYPGPLVSVAEKSRADVQAELKEYRLTHAAMSDEGAFHF